MAEKAIFSFIDAQGFVIVPGFKEKSIFSYTYRYKKGVVTIFNLLFHEKIMPIVKNKIIMNTSPSFLNWSSKLTGKLPGMVTFGPGKGD